MRTRKTERDFKLAIVCGCSMHERIDQGRSDGTGKRWSQISASECDESGEEDEGASNGYRGEVMMDLSSDSSLEGNRGKGMESQEGEGGKGPTIGGKGRLEVGDEELVECRGIGLQEVVGGPDCNRRGSGVALGLEMIGRQKGGDEIKNGLGLTEEGCGLECNMVTKGVEAADQLGVTKADGAGSGRGGPEPMDGVKWPEYAGPEICKPPAMQEGVVKHGSKEGISLGDGEKRISREKKTRKIKKLVLVQKEDFFEEMESEANRRVNAQERRRARKRATREKRKKLRLQAALESASEAENMQGETSRESNYFVDCRIKGGSAGDDDAREATQLWELGKELGVTARAGEGEIMGKLLEMEIIDRLAGAEKAERVVGNGKMESDNGKLDEDTNL